MPAGFVRQAKDESPKALAEKSLFPIFLLQAPGKGQKGIAGRAVPLGPKV